MPGDIISPRSNTTQQVNYERFGIAFSNQAALSGKMIGSIPVGSYITRVGVYIQTAFNAGTTNSLSLGVTKTNANELLQVGDITPGTVGEYTNARGNGLAATLVPTPTASAGGDDPEGGVGLWVKATFAGTAPTAGLAIFTVSYIPPNDN